MALPLHSPAFFPATSVHASFSAKAMPTSTMIAWMWTRTTWLSAACPPKLVRKSSTFGGVPPSSRYRARVCILVLASVGETGSMASCSYHLSTCAFRQMVGLNLSPFNMSTVLAQARSSNRQARRNGQGPAHSCTHGEGLTTRRQRRLLPQRRVQRKVSAASEAERSEEASEEHGFRMVSPSRKKQGSFTRTSRTISSILLA